MQVRVARQLLPALDITWDELEAHAYATSNTHIPDLEKAVAAVWQSLTKVCDLPLSPNIDVAYDDELIGQQVLGYASRTMYLRQEPVPVWVPSLFFPEYDNIDIRLRINPKVPNGWYWAGADANADANADACDTGWRYDLHTVLLHELLHGVGISSSVREGADGNGLTVGYSSGSACFPTMFDAAIHDASDDPAVHGCTLDEHGAYYVGGVELFTPDHHNQGSSFSHHAHRGSLMYYSIPARQCLRLGHVETDLLDAIGITCNASSNPVPNLVPNLVSDPVPVSDLDPGAGAVTDLSSTTTSAPHALCLCLCLCLCLLKAFRSTM